MSLLRIVSAPSSAPVVLLDLWSSRYAPIAHTFSIDSGDPTSTTGGGGQMARTESRSEERYGGAQIGYELRTNGSLQWTCLVNCADAPTLQAALATLISIVESPAPAFVQWLGLGQAVPLFFERRGPGTWKQSVLDLGQGVAEMNIVLPVAPAVLGVPVTTAGVLTAPGTFALPATAGTLPALVDVEVDVPANAAGVAWMLLAPFAPSTAGLGVRAGAALGATGLVLATESTASSGQSWVANIVAESAYSVSASIDPSAAILDVAGFERDLAVEVWVRMAYTSALMLSTLLRVQATPPAPGKARASVDMPSGRIIGDAAAGTTYRWHRCGIVRLPSEPGSGNWIVQASVVPGAGSSGTLAIDCLAFAPARRRACLPTGVAQDASYPRLTPAPSPGLGAPSTPVPTTAATGGTIPANAYGVTLTYVDQFGESTYAVAAAITTTGASSTITVPSPPARSTPAGFPATGWYAYLAPSGGQYFRQSPLMQIGTAFTLTVAPVTSGTPLPAVDSTGGAAGVTKGILNTLAGSIAFTGGARHADTGLGGAALRLAPGPSGALLMLLSPAVPDDPSVAAGVDVVGPTLNVRATVTPRYSLWSVP